MELGGGLFEFSDLTGVFCELLEGGVEDGGLEVLR